MKFRDTPIRRKLTWAIMLTSTVVLLLAGAAFMAYELATFRSRTEADLRSVAQILAVNSAGALAFEDVRDAQDVVNSVRAYPNVVQAALYTADHQLFAWYSADGQAVDLPTRPELRSGHRFDDQHLYVYQRVSHQGKDQGTLYLKYSLAAVYERVRVYGSMVLLILVGSILAALGLSGFVQKGLSQPILALARVAREISQRKDYSVRAKKPGEDELGVLTDSFNEMVTEIQRRDAVLREQEQRLRLALEGGHMGTWDWHLSTNTVHWDEYTDELFGLKRGEFQETVEAFLRLVEPQDRERIRQVIEARLGDRAELAVEFRVRRPDGPIRHLALRGKLFYDERGVPLRMTGVCLDVTEAKKAEEQIRLLNADLERRVQDRTLALTETNRELEAFTYSVAHDLRAPLRHIAAFTQILQEELGQNIPREAADMSRRIRLAVQQMGKLVDDLLNLARIGRQELKRLPTQLNPIVNEVIATFRSETQNRNIEFRVEPMPPVKCDGALMYYAFHNLISNAIKYTRPRVKAVVEVGHTATNGRTIFYVRDNGVGFGMQYADKLFGVFQRLHRADEFEGTGVGLAIVDRIIRKHGGTIWAEAEAGKGATFYFSLE